MSTTTFIRTLPGRLRYSWACATAAWRRYAWLTGGRNPDESPF